MSRNKQPYLPLYVQDWLTNIDLRSVSMAGHGLLINIMCVMHKEELYGEILLKQKFKQNSSKVFNFATQLAIHFAFNSTEIQIALEELIDEKILFFQGDSLICNRMVKDAKLSKTRALAGSNGGNTKAKKAISSTNFASTFAIAKSVANAEIEIENEIDIILHSNNINKIEKLKFSNFQNDVYYPTEKLAEVYSQDQRLISAVSKSTGKTIAFLLEQIPTFVEHLASLGRSSDTAAEFAKYFRNAMKMPLSPSWVNTKASVPATEQFVYQWQGQPSKAAGRQQYEKDKKNFGAFGFETLKSPANV